MTDYKDIEKKDDKGLVALIAEKREALRNFRFANSGSATRNVKEARDNKKDIARALTEMNARNRATNNEDNA